MEVVCFGCGSTTFALEGFARTTRRGVRYSAMLCSNCQTSPARWWLLGLVVLVVAGVSALVAVLVAGAGTEGFDLLFLPGVAVLLSIVSVFALVFEMLVAKLLGFRLLGVVLGTGAPAYRTMLRSVVLVTSWLPFGGVVNVATLHRGAYRLRRSLCGLAAPLFGLLLLLVLLPVTADEGAAGYLRSGLLLAAGGQIIISVLMPPSRVGQLLAGHGLPMHILRVPFATRPELRGDLSDGAAELALRAALRHDAGLAADAAALAIDTARDPAAMSASLLEALLLAGAHDEVATLARGLAADAAVGDGELARYLALVTWCGLLFDRDALREDGGRSAAGAVELRRWDPLALGAHGAVLVEQGAVDEGLALLLEANRLAEEGVGNAPVRAMVMSEVALAHLRQGQYDFAAAAVDEASEVGFAWPRLEQARAALPVRVSR